MRLEVGFFDNRGAIKCSKRSSIEVQECSSIEVQLTLPCLKDASPARIFVIIVNRDAVNDIVAIDAIEHSKHSSIEVQLTLPCLKDTSSVRMFIIVVNKGAVDDIDTIEHSKRSSIDASSIIKMFVDRGVVNNIKDRGA